MRHRNAKPRNDRQAEARQRALAALALMRRSGSSLTAAADLEGVAPRTVLRYVGSALRKTSSRGRYRAAVRDRIPRTVQFMTAAGPLSGTVLGSRTASAIAQHMNAVKTYLTSGDTSALQRFRGKSFRASGKSYEFVTSPTTLSQLADADVVAIEGLYRVARGGTR